jgi:hypothetical protein
MLGSDVLCIERTRLRPYAFFPFPRGRMGQGREDKGLSRVETSSSSYLRSLGITSEKAAMVRSTSSSVWTREG